MKGDQTRTCLISKRSLGFMASVKVTGTTGEVQKISAVKVWNVSPAVTKTSTQDLINSLIRAQFFMKFKKAKTGIKFRLTKVVFSLGMVTSNWSTQTSYNSKHATLIYQFVLLFLLTCTHPKHIKKKGTAITKHTHTQILCNRRKTDFLRKTVKKL